MILTRLPFNNLYSKIISIIAPEYFENGDLSLEAACYNINQWPVPTPGIALSLPLLGSVFQVYFFIYLLQFVTQQLNFYVYILYFFILQTYIPNQKNASNLSLQLASTNEVPTSTENQIQTPVDDLNLFEILQPILSHVDMLWELVITAEPLIVMASSPTYCSSMVLALIR